MKLADYKPYNGFYNLRAFKIPVKEFKKLWKVQMFLYNREMERRSGKIHPQLDEILNFPAQYQQTLFSFPVVNPDLI